MKTLLRATNWVGDVVLSLPALEALKAAFPSDHLAVLARPWVAELYRARGEPDEVLVDESAGRHAGSEGRERLAAELAERGFDRVILLPSSFETAWVAYRAAIPQRIGWRGEGRSPLLTTALSPRLWRGRHEVWKHLLLAEAAGAPMPERPEARWEVSEPIREAARARLLESGWSGGPFVAAHVASFAHAAKRWPGDGFAEVFDRVAAPRGWAVALLGTAGERAMNVDVARRTRAPVLDLSGKSSLTEALGILAEASLFVGNDSGLAHLAAAAGTPTVVVFGPTDPAATSPWAPHDSPPRVAVVRRRVACAPCRYRVCPIDHACMERLAPGAVVEAADALLAAR